MQYKAIQTKYKGCLFRSRLEARWAVFFDACNIKWEYEKEGYQLPENIYYLPDFWLPELDIFVEIKGQELLKEESKKIDLLTTATRKNLFLIIGEVPFPEDKFEEKIDDVKFSIFFPDGGRDFPYLFCECKKCGIIGIEFDGLSDRLNCDCNNERKVYNSNSLKINNAYITARSARFEFN